MGAKTKKPRPGTRARASISGTILPCQAHPGDYRFNKWEKIRLPHTQKLKWPTHGFKKGH